MNILEWEKVNTKWELSDIEIKLDTLCEIDDGIVTKMESTTWSQVTAKCFVITFCLNLNLLINNFYIISSRYIKQLTSFTENITC